VDLATHARLFCMNGATRTTAENQRVALRTLQKLRRRGQCDIGNLNALEARLRRLAACLERQGRQASRR